MAKSVQTQVTKPAAKPATQKRAAKPAAAKPEAKPAETQAPAPATLTHAVKDGFRPASGSLRFAYTAGWRQLSGMSAGKAVPRATVSIVAGSTARKYHTEKTGAFSEDAGGNLTLTEAGRVLFAKRKPDPKHVEAYTAVLSTGVLSDVVNVKTAGAIVKL